MSDNLEGVIKTVGDSNHKLSRCQEWDAHSIFTITDCSCELEPIAQHVRGLVVGPIPGFQTNWNRLKP